MNSSKPLSLRSVIHRPFLVLRLFKIEMKIEIDVDINRMHHRVCWLFLKKGQLLSQLALIRSEGDSAARPVHTLKL